MGNGHLNVKESSNGYTGSHYGDDKPEDDGNNVEENVEPEINQSSARNSQFNATSWMASTYHVQECNMMATLRVTTTMTTVYANSPTLTNPLR